MAIWVFQTDMASLKTPDIQPRDQKAEEGNRWYDKAGIPIASKRTTGEVLTSKIPAARHTTVGFQAHKNERWLLLCPRVDLYSHVRPHR